MINDAEGWIEEARRRYDVARFLHQSGHHTEALVRATYTMYAAAQGLLRSKSLISSTHAGTITLLSREFVRNGKLDRRFIALLSRTLRDRLDGDYYGKLFSEAEAKERLQEAREFIEAAEEILE